MTPYRAVQFKKWNDPVTMDGEKTFKFYCDLIADVVTIILLLAVDKALNKKSNHLNRQIGNYRLKFNDQIQLPNLISINSE